MKKITIGGMTAVGALVVILLTIYEKTEAIISKMDSAKPSSVENISDAKFSDKTDYFQEPARKK